MLTAIVALLLVVAGELRVSNQLFSAASRRASLQAAGYTPRTVALRPENNAPPQASTVQEVRIVGFRYYRYGSSYVRDFGDSNQGLPVVTSK